MKSARDYWKERFDEYPQTDADKLAVAMMQEYSSQFKPTPLTEEQWDEIRKEFIAWDQEGKFLASQNDILKFFKKRVVSLSPAPTPIGYFLDGDFYESLDQFKGMTFSEEHKPIPLYSHPSSPAPDNTESIQEAYMSYFNTHAFSDKGFADYLIKCGYKLVK